MRREIYTVLVIAVLVSSMAAKSGPIAKSRLPRVGVIKDYPATGMTVGCGNLYFEVPKKPGSLTTKYIYLARGDGSNAWLNLDGRDTRVEFLKTKTKEGASGATKYYYRFGKTNILVSITNSGRYEDDYPLLMTITLQRGELLRRVKAIGSSDC